MAIRNMDKITFDGDQIKFPASAILQEDLEGEISDLKENLTQISELAPFTFFESESISGTRLKGVTVNIPAGTYILEVDNITSTDTDASTCSVVFNANSTAKLTLNLARNAHIKKEITLSADITNIAFYAATSWPSGDGDTFEFENVIIYQNYELVNKIAAIDTDVATIKNKVGNMDAPVRGKNIFINEWEHARYDGANNNYAYLTGASGGYNTATPPNTPVDGGEYYTLSWGNATYETSSVYLFEFNADHEYITHTPVSFAGHKLTVKLNANTAFIGTQIFAPATWSDMIPDWTQLEKGIIATRYVKPYILPQNQIDYNVFPALPTYYAENGYIDAKCLRINQLCNGCIANGDAFVFITDEHWTINQKKSPDLIHYLSENCNIPMLISGGDTADKGSKDFCDLLRKCYPHRIHHVVGNHDVFSPTTANQLYYWMDIFNNDQIGDAFSHYYYVDNNQQKIRYIVLNAYVRSGDTVAEDYSTEQLSWLTSVALNIPNDWDVIVFTHWIGNTTVTTKQASFRDALDTFNSDSGHTGRVIAVFQGHAHYDAVYHTTGGIPIITTTCDKNGAWIYQNTDMEPWLTENRISGTTSEQAFDVIVVDRANKKITAVRIGALAMDNVDVNQGAEGFTYTGTLEEREISYA